MELHTLTASQLTRLKVLSVKFISKLLFCKHNNDKTPGEHFHLVLGMMEGGGYCLVAGYLIFEVTLMFAEFNKKEDM